MRFEILSSDDHLPVKTANLADVIAVCSGYTHTLAIKNDGTVWAWGKNGAGELGDGTNTSSGIPVQTLNIGDVISIDAGGQAISESTLSIKSDFSVWAWAGTIWDSWGMVRR